MEACVGRVARDGLSALQATMTNSKARLQPPPSPMFFFKIFWCLRSRFVVCSTPHKHLACTGTDAEGEDVTLLQPELLMF